MEHLKEDFLMPEKNHYHNKLGCLSLAFFSTLITTVNSSTVKRYNITVAAVGVAVVDVKTIRASTESDRCNIYNSKC
jgi:hypothetical protein